jgi:hypothetical protein
LFDGKGGRQFKNGGGRHCPAIEIYRTGRYFTVTDESIGQTDILRQVSLADLEWLIREAGPRFARKESQKSAGTDQSRSAKAFRKGAALKATGYSYDAMRDALLADADPEIADWARTKGSANGERELHRIYENAKAAPNFISPEFSEDRLALRFADRHGNDLRYVAEWGKWLAWTGTWWDIEKSLLAPYLAREICREAASERNTPSESKAIVKWRTINAVETMARLDRRIAAIVSQWDANQSFFNCKRKI